MGKKNYKKIKSVNLLKSLKETFQITPSRLLLFLNSVKQIHCNFSGSFGLQQKNF